MKYLILLLTACVFYFGFFTSNEVNNSLMHKFGDKHLHVISFCVLPLFLFFIFRNKPLFIIGTTIFFGLMTYGVELFQKLFTHRQYSLVDFKFSLYGFCAYLLIILIYISFSNISIKRNFV